MIGMGLSQILKRCTKGFRMMRSSKINTEKLVVERKNTTFKFKELLISNIDYIFLTILLLFHTTINYIWFKKDTLPPGWDQSGHLILSLKYIHVLTTPSLDVIPRLISVSNYYPPLFHISASPFYLLFGTSDDVACMSTIIFLGILIFSTYGIGKYIYNRNTGLLSAFLVSMYPIIFGENREYLIDIPVVALVALSIYVLLLTNNFKNKRYSIVFGITLGLGMLTKWTFIFFVIGPFCYVLFRSFTWNLSFWTIKRLIFLGKVKKPFILCCFSGIAFGLFSWAYVKAVFEKNFILDTWILLYALLLGVIISLLIWVVFSWVVSLITEEKFEKILQLDSYSFISSFILLLYFKQFFSYTVNFGYHLVIAFITLMILLKFYFLKDHLIGSLKYLFGYQYQKVYSNKNLITLNILISVLLGILIMSIWYFPNFAPVLYFLSSSSAGGVLEGDPPIFTLKSVLYYLFNLINHQIFLPCFIFFLIGFIYMIKTKDKNKAILLLWIILPYLIFTFTSNKDIRYTMPFLPAIAVISTSWISMIGSKKAKSIIIVSLLIIATFQFIAITNGIDAIQHQKVIKTPLYDIKIYSQHVHITHPPVEQNWKIQEILRYITNKSKNMSQNYHCVVGIVPNAYRFQQGAFEYYTLLEKLPLHIIGVGRSPNFYGEVFMCDYVVTKTGDQGPGFTTKYIIRTMDMLKSPPKEFNETFKIVKEYNLPDGSIAKIYKRMEPRKIV